MRIGIASGVASIRNLCKAAFKSISKKWPKFKKKSDDKIKAKQVRKGNGKDASTGNRRKLNGATSSSTKASIMIMSCHNLSLCGLRPHKKKANRKSCSSLPEVNISSGTECTNNVDWDSSSFTPISKSGPILNCTSGRRSTTIMFSNSSGMLKPPAIERQLECTLEELCFGCNKKIRVTRAVVKDNGQMVQEEETVTINVKPGWKKGTKVTFEGLGNERPVSYPADLVFVIAEKSHPLFVKEGDDLELTVEISLIQALTGCTISIPLLGGENTTLIIEDIIHPGYGKTIPNQGMPIATGEEKRGNLKVVFLVEFPTYLTQEQRSEVVNILKDS